MTYIQGQNRKQYILFPNCMEEYIKADAPVRLFDAFVDSLDMGKLGFIRSKPAATGTPGYNPRDLLKLYIYGYFYRIKSSRRLAHECSRNIEVMWLINQLTPDFRTIADFRKDNAKCVKLVFKEFNKFCVKAEVYSLEYVSVDGSKFHAVNAKDNNFTLSKLDDRLKRLNEHIQVYMKELEENDEKESGRLDANSEAKTEEDASKLSKEKLEEKLQACLERKALYEGYRDEMEKSGVSQISLTDPDSKLMKFNEGFEVGYNVQTAVESKSHMIAGYNVTNDVTDHGQLTQTVKEVKEDFEKDILNGTADKGYQNLADHAEALANGIIPNVIQRDGKSTEIVEFEYHEQEISDELKLSTKPEDLRACLEAGVIPEAYKEILEGPEYAEVKIQKIEDSDVLRMTDEEMCEMAKDGYFVRDAERNFVYCPQGQMLRQKRVLQNGYIRYCNKLACKKCQCKCTQSKHKEIDFTKDTLIKAANPKNKQKLKEDKKDKPKLKKTTIVKKIVRYVLKLNQEMMDNRKCLSEHPFGTIKRALGHYFFLLKGFIKVEAEMGLYCLSYNLRRAINLKGVPALVANLR